MRQRRHSLSLSLVRPRQQPGDACCIGIFCVDSISLTFQALVQATKWELVQLDQADTSTCGAKAAACGRLLQLAQASGGLFKAPAGTVVPFGIMNLALKVCLCCHAHAVSCRT